MDHESDVIVVGGGGSGLAAACSAAEVGGRVLVLERREELGGTTGIAVGSFTAAETRLQRAQGIEDSAEAHDEDAGKFAPEEIEARNHVALRRYFLSQAADTLHWLQGLGLSFYGPSPEPPNRQPRMHNVVPGAKAYIAALKNALLGCGGTILCNARVTSLLSEEGRVVGVRATIDGEPREFRATRGVILAAGDYANSPELIAQHKGPRFANIEGVNPLATGDGHRLAADLGAPLVNMDVTYGPELRFVAPIKEAFHQRLPVGGRIGRLMGAAARRLPRWLMSRFIKRLLVTWQHPEDALLTDGAILVNQHGDRFTNELDCPQREIDVADQPDKVCYVLLGERLIKRYSAWPHFISTAPDIAYAYVADYQRLRPDVTTSAATLEQLAARRKLDPARLTAAVEAFNRYATGGECDAFRRTGDAHPLAGPWVLLGPAKAYFTTTEGGAKVDQELRVLGSDGTSIPGLFAVGQNGLGGMILWGHGLHIAWAMTSGRLAGQSVMGRRHEGGD